MVGFVVTGLLSGSSGKDILELRCTPPMGLSGYQARVFFRIEHPEKLYCPSVTIYWPEGYRSGPRQADCDPLLEEEEAGPWSSADLWPNGIHYEVPSGRNIIKVEVETPSKRVSQECFVEGQ
jgi:hypothetical protein